MAKQQYKFATVPTGTLSVFEIKRMVVYNARHERDYINLQFFNNRERNNQLRSFSYKKKGGGPSKLYTFRVRCALSSKSTVNR